MKTNFAMSKEKVVTVSKQHEAVLEKLTVAERENKKLKSSNGQNNEDDDPDSTNARDSVDGIDRDGDSDGDAKA